MNDLKIKPNKDYYHILGVRKGASLYEIKTAYRTLVMKYHPDKNNSKDAAEKFREISEAYSFLTKLNKNFVLTKREKKREKRKSVKDIKRAIKFSIHKAVDLAVKNIAMEKVISKTLSEINVRKMVSCEIRKIRKF